MKTSIILSIILSSALVATAATEDSVHQTRPAQPGGKLVVDVDFGSITVTPGDNDKVVVNAWRKIDSSSKANEERYFKAVPVEVTTDGNTIYVRATRRHESVLTELHNLLSSHSTEGRYTIKVPAQFSSDLNTAGGAISVSGTTGSVKADTSGGDLNFAQVHGAINADTSGGDITVKSCNGNTDLDTSGGNIQVTDSGGKLRADTSGGHITVANFSGDTKVDSSGGKLRLAGISGELKAETSGGAIEAILPAPVGGDVSLETSAGAITVLAPKNASLTIDAEASAGSIHSDLPLTDVRSDDDSFRGTLNGGEKKLVLRSSAGSIKILSADNETAQQ